MINILRIGSLRSPPPFRLRRTSPASGGKVVATATKGGMHFLERSEAGLFSGARRAVVKVFAAKGGIKNGARKGAVPRQRSDTI